MMRVSISVTNELAPDETYVATVSMDSLETCDAVARTAYDLVPAALLAAGYHRVNVEAACREHD